MEFPHGTPVHGALAAALEVTGFAAPAAAYMERYRRRIQEWAPSFHIVYSMRSHSRAIASVAVNPWIYRPDLAFGYIGTPSETESSDLAGFVADSISAAMKIGAKYLAYQVENSNVRLIETLADSGFKSVMSELDITLPLSHTQIDRIRPVYDAPDVSLIALRDVKDTLVNDIAALVRNSASDIPCWFATDRVPIDFFVQEFLDETVIDGASIVAIIGGKPVAFCLATDRAMTMTSAYIEFMVVDPAFRRRGIGGCVRHQCLSALLASGRTEFSTVVESSHSDVLSAYRQVLPLYVPKIESYMMSI
ncbi:GNAT family N-acetyltransferase [Ancylobacter sp. Lp-2]|uniref:GNAT family N-acetyltransferase n=1 Tax=Ancylobacter sp. Lp-2 TaxID=2881339 RepID=UPI001E45CFF8|nr:GNAT family N-acetyltransferase [Ancylobacter sp. Lp-2]MCB4767051.1 GNAT family N-acetyltransferase [Ancylobacter sp. Lp-2]